MLMKKNHTECFILFKTPLNTFSNVCTNCKVISKSMAKTSALDEWTVIFKFDFLSFDWSKEQRPLKIFGLNTSGMTLLSSNR